MSNSRQGSFISFRQAIGSAAKNVILACKLLSYSFVAIYLLELLQWTLVVTKQLSYYCWVTLVCSWDKSSGSSRGGGLDRAQIRIILRVFVLFPLK